MVRLLYILLVVYLASLGPGMATAEDQTTAETGPESRTTQFGAGLSYKYPYSSYNDTYSPGWGIQALLSYPFIPVLDLIANIGWNRFPHDNDGADIDIWEFVGGARFRLGAFFMSGEVGYYTNIDAVSFQPGLGLKFEKWEIALSTRSVDSGSWHGIRVGYYF